MRREARAAREDHLGDGGGAGDRRAGERAVSPRSTRKTTSGSSTASSASKSPCARGGQERVDDLALPREVGVGLGAAPRTRRLPRLASWRAASGVRSTIGAISSNGIAEHVVQHEREPLGGRERLEHDEQREPDRVGEQRLLLRVASSIVAG